ncbi:hypothetical protein N180_02825 [Pedobacter antarcticus 4BY]|uniref:Uncharacterized protein n=2 Tax=Pedobacter antarcticus TaxID=34086 RepID=A0A081PKH6_9SPHI|nr:hypothetical protein [Pedobacter antarcticus]KEQ31199.1 hypothetical protein N180_02825 [Pedobacter antarcticus 4BY]SFE54719.1 hypothetical protein SAMN03003324_00853 [Pedobacter antarcticus]
MRGLKLDNLDFDADFNIDDFSDELDIEFETRYIKPPKAKEIAEINLKYSKAEDLARDITKLRDHRYFVIINGTFVFGDFIEAFLVGNNIHVKRMTISTLSLSENNVDSLANLLNGGYVDELNMIVSDFFYSHERNNLIPYLYERLDKNNRFQLAAASTHCKICIFETHCGNHVVIHGSANLRSSSNIEQIVIEENKVLYDFNNEYQNHIIDKFRTINKSIRGKELWHQVQVENLEGAEEPVKARRRRQKKELLN